MIYELNEREYYKIRPLVKEREEVTISLNAIISGNNQGKIWVDNVQKPTTALVWAIGCTYFLIGDPNNEGFNNCLNNYITEVIGPCCTSTYGPFATHFVATVHEKEWVDRLDVLFKQRNPYKEFEYCYLFNEKPYENYKDKIKCLPYGYAVKKIDRKMINNDTENLIVDDILDGFWSSVEKFLDKGIGFCILKDHKVISNCFSGYVSGNLHEIVVRTYGEENKRKGFGTLVARAFIDYCILEGITPHWSTDENNIGSKAIAEKCGFELYNKFKTYCFPFIP